MSSLTGGSLNLLNGKYGISAPQKSVPVMKLIRNHNPKSRQELVHLIREHSEKDCACGIISMGSIEDFGKNLHEAQLEEWGTYRYTLEECIKWEYDLFITQSLKGNLIEQKAKNILLKALEGMIVKDSNDYYDEELRIDLVIKKGEENVAGVQVKPESFHNVRAGVRYMNKHRNTLVGFPVFYLFYDYNTEEFINLSEVIEGLGGLSR
jgi:hypothetical protein